MVSVGGREEERGGELGGVCGVRCVSDAPYGIRGYLAGASVVSLALCLCVRQQNQAASREYRVSQWVQWASQPM